MVRSLLQLAASLGIACILVAVLYIDGAQAPVSLLYQPASTTPSITESTSTPLIASTTVATSTAKKTPVKKAAAKAQKSQIATTTQGQSATTSTNEVHRIENPYPFPPLASDSINQSARAALVNVFCQTAGGPISSISGSGVIIDPRGVILTNAHVAQYVLLSTEPAAGLNCYIRTGSPAEIHWNVGILYIPAAWVQLHAQDIVKSKPKGTGENDYALLVITGSTDGNAPPTTFPYLPPDTREAIGFTSDPVLVAAYPAEFAGASTQTALYPSTVFTRIGDLLTFDESTVDIISLGSVAVAQGGSSGGGAVNEWGRLVGVVTTTSEGETTANRELRAITLAYINRDMLRKTGSTLLNYIGADPLTKARSFTQNEAPLLAKQVLGNLQGR